MTETELRYHWKPTNKLLVSLHPPTHPRNFCNQEKDIRDTPGVTKAPYGSMPMSMPFVARDWRKRVHPYKCECVWGRGGQGGEGTGSLVAPFQTEQTTAPEPIPLPDRPLTDKLHTYCSGDSVDSEHLEEIPQYVQYIYLTVYTLFYIFLKCFFALNAFTSSLLSNCNVSFTPLFSVFGFSDLASALHFSKFFF